ncbi:Universal stress protein [Candidatus Promineifilum breve]|uniref:Universal stress protein n=1 Tax=Candidatus Promineifilum breve TaxID=1806508 RepID=A0A160SXQ4_9CHLR|nr:universal stress protein [Candidatus Promineifilum breve]CUS01936.1 Universal stress protein [Candidatus Promineifilum breve]
MYKTILVPLDGSEVAEAILPHVEELAKLFGSTVILLQVMELPHLIALPKGEIYDALPQLTPAEVNQQLGETRRYLDGLVARLDADDISARALVENGPVVVTILRVARQEEAGLIAMASHGRGGPADVYYGSVAAGVLQRIDRPLLIVRAQK